MGPAGPAGGGRGGPGGPGGQRPEIPPIGKIADVKAGVANGIIVSDIQKSVAIPKLATPPNVKLKHDAAGVLGVSGPNTFYLTLAKNQGFDRKYTAIGKVIAGADVLKDLKRDDAIRAVRLTRVGQTARDFKTDDEGFKALMEKATKK